MNTILDYLTIDIITMYENNIKQHYIVFNDMLMLYLIKKKLLKKLKIIKKIIINY